ncbi:MAG: Uma2 family endonuclease [SAR324 cluster bacterium]|nr:Uma2 family endonuclease [SAR324 cluster bacterium]
MNITHNNLGFNEIKMAASVVHSAIQVNLSHELRKLSQYRIYSELSVMIDGNEYKPDVCVYPYRDIDWTHDLVKTEEIPLLAIEILSPKQMIQDVVDKVDVYLEAGVKSCWVIASFPRSIAVCEKQRVNYFSSGDLVDEQLDIRITIDDIFR